MALRSGGGGAGDDIALRVGRHSIRWARTLTELRCLTIQGRVQAPSADDRAALEGELVRMRAILVALRAQYATADADAEAAGEEGADTNAVIALPQARVPTRRQQRQPQSLLEEDSIDVPTLAAAAATAGGPQQALPLGVARRPRRSPAAPDACSSTFGALTDASISAAEPGNEAVRPVNVAEDEITAPPPRAAPLSSASAGAAPSLLTIGLRPSQCGELPLPSLLPVEIDFGGAGFARMPASNTPDEQWSGSAGSALGVARLFLDPLTCAHAAAAGPSTCRLPVPILPLAVHPALLQLGDAARWHLVVGAPPTHSLSGEPRDRGLDSSDGACSPQGWGADGDLLLAACRESTPPEVDCAAFVSPLEATLCSRPGRLHYFHEGGRGVGDDDEESRRVLSFYGAAVAEALAPLVGMDSAAASAITGSGASRSSNTGSSPLADVDDSDDMLDFS